MGLSIGLLVYILLFEKKKKKKKTLCDTPLLKGLDFYIKTLLYLISCMINTDLVYSLRLC